MINAYSKINEIFLTIFVLQFIILESTSLLFNNKSNFIVFNNLKKINLSFFNFKSKYNINKNGIFISSKFQSLKSLELISYGILQGIIFSFFLEFFENEFLSLLDLFLLFYFFISFLILYTVRNSNDKINNLRFYTFLAITILAGYEFLLSFNGNLIHTFCSLELLSFFVYLFIGLHTQYETDLNILTMDMGLKAYLYGCVFSCLFVFGASLIYFVYGTLSYNEIFFLNLYQSLDSLNLDVFSLFEKLSTFGFLCILITFFYKMGFLPFHTMAVDLYGIMAFGPLLILVTLFKFLYLVAIFFFMSLLSASSFITISKIVYLIAFLNIIFVSLLTYGQEKIKRFFLYMSLIPTVTILLFFVLPTVSSIVNGILFIFFYIIHTFLLWTLFLFISNNYTFTNIFNRSYSHLANSWYFRQIFVSDFTGFIKSHPVLGGIIVYIMFNFSGLPILLFFFLKVSLVESFISLSYANYAFIYLSISILPLAYYLRFIKIVAFETKTESAYPKLFEKDDIDRVFKTKQNESLALCISFLFIFSILSVLYGEFFSYIIEYTLLK